MRISYGAGDALRLARAQRPDIVFLDLSGVAAAEVARQLRGEPNLQRVLIAALHAAPLPQDAQRSPDPNIDYWLSAPPDLELIKRLLGRRR